jgi:hypothetical protein
MSAPETPHRQAPIDLRDVIGRAADFLRVVQDMNQLNWPGETERTTARLLVDELRALLPQPPSACPNCGHADGEHTGYCQADSSETGVDRCGCLITREALPTVRALVAAERDATPARPEPRVWNAGDPEPEDVEQISDRDGDIWDRGTDCWWHSPETRDYRWEHIARKWSPLTEVLAAEVTR